MTTSHSSSVGHLSVFHGAMPIMGIQWNDAYEIESVTGEELVGVFSLGPNDLSGYLMRGNLELHTDPVQYPGMMSIKIILTAEDDFELVTKSGSIKAGQGNVFTLNPREKHGATTAGFFAFAVSDYLPHLMPDPETFRAAAISLLRNYLQEKSARYMVATNWNPNAAPDLKQQNHFIAADVDIASYWSEDSEMAPDQQSNLTSLDPAITS